MTHHDRVYNNIVNGIIQYMNKIGKNWGFSSNIFLNDSVQIDRIEILKGQSCSKHYHEHKYNLFFVEKGSIIVYTWNDDLKIKTKLNTYESLVVQPKIYHQFESLENSIVYEIYYTKLDNNDIVRNYNEF